MWIKNYILTIVAIILISVIAESLMPETKTKKHISLVAGLMIIFAIAKPILSVPRLNFENIEDFLNEEGISSSQEISTKIAEARVKEVDNVFKTALCESISENLYKNFGEKYDVEAVVLEGTVEYIQLGCVTDEQIESYIKDTYGVKCVFVGE